MGARTGKLLGRHPHFVVDQLGMLKSSELAGKLNQLLLETVGERGRSIFFRFSPRCNGELVLDGPGLLLVDLGV